MKREHIQSPMPGMYPSTSRLEQAEAALAEAKRHKLRISHNPVAVKHQEAIIADWEKRVATLKGDSWLS